MRADLQTGRTPDVGHSERADRVAVLGPDAARRLGIQNLEQLPAISIGDHLYLVIGILSDVARKPELLGLGHHSGRNRATKISVWSVPARWSWKPRSAPPT